MLLRAAGGSLRRAATFRQVPCGRPQIFNRRPGQARPPARGGRAQKIKVATMLILWGCFEATIMSLVPLKGPRANVGCGSAERPPGGRSNSQI
jgi:hypothetical protein